MKLYSQVGNMDNELDDFLWISFLKQFPSLYQPDTQTSLHRHLSHQNYLSSCRLLHPHQSFHFLHDQTHFHFLLYHSRPLQPEVNIILLIITIRIQILRSHSAYRNMSSGLKDPLHSILLVSPSLWFMKQNQTRFVLYNNTFAMPSLRNSVCRCYVYVCTCVCVHAHVHSCTSAQVHIIIQINSEQHLTKFVPGWHMLNSLTGYDGFWVSNIGFGMVSSVGGCSS